MATPVFVVGKHRSGTTWLANLLCAHPSIAGIQHERHFGIHESAFFSHIEERYGDLTQRSNYIEMVEVLAASDYFRLAGATKEYLYSLWPTTYPALFRQVMDRFADGQGASHWVEKTPLHTLLVDELANTYPDARFVGIIRDVEEVVASTLAHGSKKRPEIAKARYPRARVIFGTVFSWNYYNRHLTALAERSDRVLLLRYEDLKGDVVGVLARICAFLGVPPDPAMHVPRFAPNSSFGGGRNDAPALTTREQTAIAAASRLFKLYPRSLRSWPIDPRRRREGPLPEWFFRLLTLEPGEGNGQPLASEPPSWAVDDAPHAASGSR